MTTLNLIFPIDYILIIISLLFIIISAWKGFIQSVLGLMTWLGSILITLYSYAEFANFINSGRVDAFMATGKKYHPSDILLAALYIPSSASPIICLIMI